MISAYVIVHGSSLQIGQLEVVDGRISMFISSDMSNE